MTINQRIDALVQLGKKLSGKDEYLEAFMHRTHYNNRWFTIENQQRAVKAIVEQFLQEDKLKDWLGHYNLSDPVDRITVGLVMAGNIPLVGFHDLLCVFAAGHKSIIKLSDKDKYLLPYLLKLLFQANPTAESYFEIVEKLTGYEAVIATGSNNSARYFTSYFGKVPHIIRKNRNAVAVLDGTETEDDLLALGKDIFRFFGLGCRNVSKLYLPAGYDFQLLLERLHDYKEIILHHKYKNNFDYNLALLMMNRTQFWNNGCLILTEQESIASRIALLNYSFYENLGELSEELEQRQEEIQCIVSKTGIKGMQTVPFGKAQEPTLLDYADGTDTMTFLTSL